MSCDNLALVEMSDRLYNFAAACPAELVGYVETAVIHHPAFGERTCLDRGGMINVQYGYLEGIGWLWYIPVDLLETGPHPSNWTLLWGWSYEWVNTAGVTAGLN